MARTNIGYITIYDVTDGASGFNNATVPYLQTISRCS